MFASTCGTWLVSATRRSCAAASIATGVAPTSVMKPCTRRWRSGSVWATGVRNHVAPSNRPALAFSAPRVSEPQIGCPPTKRAEPAAAATTLDLVEPTSVTVASPGAASTAATVAGSCAIGEATTTSSASATASSRLVRGGRPPRARPRRRARPGRGPSPPTSSPRRTRSERDGRAHQPRSDDGDLHVSTLRTVGLANLVHEVRCEIDVVPQMNQVREFGVSEARAASARRGGTPGRATGARSGAGRRASRSATRAATRARRRRRRGTPSRPCP